MTNQKILIESESTLHFASTNQLDKFMFNSHDIMSSQLFYVVSIKIDEVKCAENKNDINIIYLARYRSHIKNNIEYYCLFNYKNGTYKPVYDGYPVRHKDMFVFTSKFIE